MDEGSKLHLKHLNEHLKMWRALNGVTIKPLSNAALKGIKKNGASRHNTSEMQWLVDEVKDLCRTPVSDEFVADVMDLNLYDDAQALVALTHPDKHTDSMPKVVGVVVFGSHDPDIPMEDDEDDDDDDDEAGPSMQWNDASVDRLAINGRLAEIYLLCKAEDGPGGLGRYLTAAAMYAIAKRRKQRAPLYRGVVCSIAHERRAGVASAEAEPNYKLFTSLGGKAFKTSVRGTKVPFIEQGDDGPRTYLAIHGPGHRWAPNRLIKTSLRIPKDIVGICPMEPRTGLQRCA